MGDRYFDARHPNIELLLRRPPTFPAPLAGIGHNGGPPLEMSWHAWLWRRALAKAWETPPREIALRRLRRAEALGLSYRDYTAALLDKGCHLSTALLPLQYAATPRMSRDGAIDLLANPHLVDRIARFEGCLLLLADETAFGPLDAGRLRLLRGQVTALFDGKAQAVIALPFQPDDTLSGRAARLRRRLKTRGVSWRECFLLGTMPAELDLAEEARLGAFLPLAQWFAGQ